MEKAENEDAAIDHVVDRLTSQFPSVPAEDIATRVSEVRSTFDEAPIRDFVPVIVEHDVKDQLREEGHTPEPAAAEPSD